MVLTSGSHPQRDLYEGLLLMAMGVERLGTAERAARFLREMSAASRPDTTELRSGGRQRALSSPADQRARSLIPHGV